VPAADQGAALVMALVAMAMLIALGVALVVASQIERIIADSHRAGSETLYAAEGAAEWAVGEIQGRPQWDDLLAGTAQTGFVDSTLTPLLASNERVDLTVLTGEIQRESDGVPLGSNRPIWRLIAYGPITRLMGLSIPRSSAYVAVWLADDPSDADDNPVADANGVVSLAVVALGSAQSRRGVDVRLARVPAGGPARVLSWREMR
jgi:hypothetical protein